MKKDTKKAVSKSQKRRTDSLDSEKALKEIEKTNESVKKSIEEVDKMGKEFDEGVKTVTAMVDDATIMVRNPEIRLYEGDQFWFFKMAYKPHANAQEIFKEVLIRHSNALSAYLLAKDYCQLFFDKDARIVSVTKI